MSVFHNNALIGASGQGAAAAAGYTVERSIRINSADSAYLNRTPSSAGNRKTWTWSGWIKRSEIGSYNYIFNVYSDASNYGFFNFDADKLRFGQVSGGSASYSRTTSLYRDASAWYHIFLAVDTTQSTGSDRIKIYVNGVQQTVFDVTWTPSQNADLQFNNTTNHALGTYLGGVSSYGLDGYFADVHFIDGQALDPTDFGEFDANNVWQPIEYAGTYGTNGFHLDFSDNSSASALGTDSSGNSNDWTVNNFDPGPISTTVAGMAWSSALGTEPTWSNFPSLTTIDTDSLADPTSFTINSFSGVGSNLYFGYWWSSDGASWTRSGSNALSPPYTVTPVSRYLRLALAGGSSVTSATAGTETFTSAFATGSDSLFDSPTNGTQTDTGAGGEVSGNYATWNPLFTSSNSARTTISNGNLDVTSVTTPGNYAAVFATLGISSGKFYWEVTQNNSAAIMLGIAPASNPRNNYYLGESLNEWGYYSGNGTVYSGGSSAASYTQYSTGDVVGIAFDADNGKLFFSLNGTWQGSSDPAAGTNPAASGITTLPQFPAVSEGTASQTLDVSANFGQRAFAYTAPSGYKALCTANLDDPTIADGSTAMDVVTYSGNSSSQTISGLNFSPDLVWIKCRSTAYNHAWNDTVRGALELLSSSMTDAEYTDTTGVDSFTSDGWTFNGTGFYNVNGAGDTYVGWAWDGGSSTVANTDGSISSSVRANASAGFSIVSYTGTGSAATVGHSLGVKPDMVVIKNRSTAGYDWKVMHEGMTGAMGTYQIQLNRTDAESAASASWFNSTSPTSTVFSVGTLSAVNGSGESYIAYCWAPVEGYSAFGSYTGNGSTDGPFVYTGHRTRWLMVKRTDSSGSWWMWDTERDTYNLSDAVLRADNAAAENTYSGLTDVDILSNGFKWRGNGADVNASGGSYIFMSFAENPFKHSRAR